MKWFNFCQKMKMIQFMKKCEENKNESDKNVLVIKVNLNDKKNNDNNNATNEIKVDLRDKKNNVKNIEEKNDG